jgi:hypothetical protein
MRWTIALGWLAACTPLDGEDPDLARAPLSVNLRVREPPPFVDDLSVRVEQVVLSGYGPEGPASVSVSVERAFTLLGADADIVPITALLPVGEWGGVQLSVHLTSREAEPALRVQGPLEDERRYVASVLALSFEGSGGFTLDDRGTSVDLTFSPGEWDELNELDEEDDDEDDDDDVVRVDVARHPDRYEALVDEILATTEVQFGGGDDE